MIDPNGFVRANTALGRHPLVPEIELYLASELTPIWQATEELLAREGVAPPYWAFAWPGSAALARLVLDRPELVRGKRVLDFAAGGGLLAVACAMAGAEVEAVEIDPLAVAAIERNAAQNQVDVRAVCADVVGSACRWDMILCGDVCYEAAMTAHILPWLRTMAEHVEVWIADPGRAYMPKTGLEAMLTTVVPTTLELEDHTSRSVTIWRIK